MRPVVELPYELLQSWCRDNGIRRMSVFGSAAKGTLGADSDIDLLVEFEHPLSVGFFRLMEMQEELTQMLGRPVDLQTRGSISRHFIDKVEEEAISIHG